MPLGPATEESKNKFVVNYELLIDYILRYLGLLVLSVLVFFAVTLKDT